MSVVSADQVFGGYFDFNGKRVPVPEGGSVDIRADGKLYVNRILIDFDSLPDSPALSGSSIGQSKKKILISFTGCTLSGVRHHHGKQVYSGCTIDSPTFHSASSIRIDGDIAGSSRFHSSTVKCRDVTGSTTMHNSTVKKGSYKPKRKRASRPEEESESSDSDSPDSITIVNDFNNHGMMVTSSGVHFGSSTSIPVVTGNIIEGCTFSGHVGEFRIGNTSRPTPSSSSSVTVVHGGVGYQSSPRPITNRFGPTLKKERPD
jgi:hypothetical protein